MCEYDSLTYVFNDNTRLKIELNEVENCLDFRYEVTMGMAGLPKFTTFKKDGRTFIMLSGNRHII